MLDLNATGPGGENQTHTTQVRHSVGLAALIKRAAMALGFGKSAFIRNVIAKGARRVAGESPSHVLTEEDAKLFSAALDTPPAPTPRALKAAASYRRRVANAD